MIKYFSLFYSHKISVFISIITIILDQLSKFLIIIFLPLGNSWPQEGILRFTHARNTGAAFSLFQDQSLILSIVSVIAVIFILFVFKSINNPSLLILITFRLQIGGAFGNLISSS